jgi:hypothetical protein
MGHATQSQEEVTPIGSNHTYREETRPISTGHATLSHEEVTPIGCNHTCQEEMGGPRRTQHRHSGRTLWLLSMSKCTIQDHGRVHVEFAQQASKGHQLTALNTTQRQWGGVHQTLLWEETRPISTGQAMQSQEEVTPIGHSHTCQEEIRPIGTGHATLGQEEMKRSGTLL